MSELTGEKRNGVAGMNARQNNVQQATPELHKALADAGVIKERVGELRPTDAEIELEARQWDQERGHIPTTARAWRCGAVWARGMQTYTSQPDSERIAEPTIAKRDSYYNDGGGRMISLKHYDVTLERIEDLEAVIEANHECHDSADRRIAELEREVERLREALEAFVSLFDVPDDMWVCPSCGPTGCTFDGRCERCGIGIESSQPDTSIISDGIKALATEEA